MKRKITILILVMFIMLFGISNCVALPTSKPINITSAELVIENTIPATPSITHTLPLTFTPFPPTIIPTLQIEDANAEILNLLSNPCAFPCWWGFTPNETLITDMQNYLSRFNALSGGMPIFDEDGGYRRIEFEQAQETLLSITFSFKGNNNILETLNVVLQNKTKINNNYGDTGYQVSWKDSRLTEVAEPYSLSNILSTYGAPTEVFLFTHEHGFINRPWPISLVVFYPKKGFLIEYVADNKISSNPSVLTWCPTFAFPNFGFWSPSDQITWNNLPDYIHTAYPEYGGSDWTEYRTIQEATSMNIEDFHSLYTANDSACVSTPSNTNLWPKPFQ